MQKIKNIIVERMIEKNCTANEIAFLLYISMFQDIAGRVTGVHYKDVCNAIDISIQGYYDVKESLERKGFIKCKKCDYSDCDITIIGNAYTGEKYNREGYINTNHNIFFCKEFHELKANAKLLAMKLMIITSSGKGYFEIGVKKFYDKETGYQKRFGVSRRVMRSYLMSLKTLFSIGIKDGKYYIEPKKIIYRRKGTKEEVERFREKGTEVVLRRNRIKEPGAGEKEIYNLIKQYENTADKEKKQLVHLLDRAVKKSLEIINKGQQWLKYKIINMKLIHKLLREELFGTEQKVPLERTVGDDSTEDDKQKETKRTKNKFNNFPQREYDYNELERFLLTSEPAQG